VAFRVKTPRPAEGGDLWVLTECRSWILQKRRVARTYAASP
jgi:hypothetical protein